MASFLRILNLIRQPDIVIYRTGRAIDTVYQHLIGASIEQRRDNSLSRRLTDVQLSAFRQSQTRFFFDPRDLPDYVCTEQLVRYAEDVCLHRLDLLGSGPLNLGEHIDWHQDPVSGYRWPNTFIGDLTIDQADGADIKWVWELSRFQFLPLLGIAHRKLGEPRYLNGAVSLVSDWIAGNPVYRGPNWYCPMDVAIRACNWLYWWRLISDRHEVDVAFERRFLASLFTHGRFIYRNLERHPANTNNHYLANLAGLAYLGLLLPGNNETREWYIFARKELERQIWRQILPDGVGFEASIPYHRLALELITYPALLYRLNGPDLSYEAWRHLERAFEYVAAYTPSHGLAPQIGDNDSGRLHTIVQPFDWQVNDHRYLLDLAARVFPDNFAFAHVTDSSEEAQWFVSSIPSKSEHDSTASVGPSQAFPDAGIYVLRNQTIHCLVDCGPVGQNGVGAHAHNDTLSFTLSVGGHRVIADTGTGHYTRSAKIRNLLRSTAVHNTVRIAGIEINDIPRNNCFRLPGQDRPKVLSWTSDAASDRLAACHYGYTKLDPQVVHLRAIALEKQTDILTVTDRFLGEGGHIVEWHIPLDPSVDCRLVDDRIARVVVGDVSLDLNFGWKPDRIELLQTQYSESYGRIEPNTTLHIVVHRSDDRSYTWEIRRSAR